MTFSAELFRIPGKGGWTFVVVPPEHAPAPTRPWGRTPVRATVDGVAFETSVWRDRARGCLLAVPARIRRGKEHGDVVTVRLEPVE